MYSNVQSDSAKNPVTLTRAVCSTTHSQHIRTRYVRWTTDCDAYMQQVIHYKYKYERDQRYR